jgi:hypothetical protein
VLLALIVALATYYITIDASSIRAQAQPFGRATPDRIITAAVIIGVSIVAQAFEATYQRRKRIERDAVSREVLRLLFPIWVGVERRLQRREMKDTFGLHVWLVPRWHWTLVPRPVRKATPRGVRARFPTPQMWHAAELRMRSDQPSTEISWRRGKGVVGMCWRRRHFFYFDAAANWGAARMDEAAWGNLSANDKLGLSYGEYVRLSSKYNRAFAVPIFRHGSQARDPEFIGCVVLDEAAGVEQFDIDTVQVRGELAALANLVSLQVR